MNANIIFCKNRSGNQFWFRSDSVLGCCVDSDGSGYTSYKLLLEHGHEINNLCHTSSEVIARSLHSIELDDKENSKCDGRSIGLLDINNKPFDFILSAYVGFCSDDAKAKTYKILLTGGSEIRNLSYETVLEARSKVLALSEQK